MAASKHATTKGFKEEDWRPTIGHSTPNSSNAKNSEQIQEKSKIASSISEGVKDKDWSPTIGRSNSFCEEARSSPLACKAWHSEEE